MYTHDSLYTLDPMHSLDRYLRDRVDLREDRGGSGPPQSQGLTRRQLLRRAGTALALAAGGGAGAAVLLDREPRHIRSYRAKPAGDVREFVSRPDLRPPNITTTLTGGRAAIGHDRQQGFLFLGPGPVSLSGGEQYGPLIVDHHGEPVWFRPLPSGLEVANFATATYRREPVLVWWQGTILSTGYGQGEAVIVDRSYRELARVKAANGRSMDLHAIWLSPRGTAVFTCYPEMAPADLSHIGGPKNGQVLQSIVQEVDIASGRLLFEWRSLEHVPVEDSYLPFAEPYDYVHVNSIASTPDGNLLVSGRHTWALYKLERRTGKVMWTLGGKSTNFQLGRGADFAWQHDAREVSQGLFTVFDNGSDGDTTTESQSRALLLRVDEKHRSVKLTRAYVHPDRLQSSAMGSVEILPSGNVVVGWGTASHTSEFRADGELLFDAALPAAMYSYRGLRLAWSSNPREAPAVVAARDPRSPNKLLYASWNGATAVGGWRVDAGPSHDHLRTVGIARSRGFETVIPLRGDFGYATVTALDHGGQQLARSESIML